jgi:MFS family permease
MQAEAGACANDSAKRFSSDVRLLIAGTGFVALARSMSMPFLAIYLTRQMGLNPGTIGLIIGLGALAATFGGLAGGSLSDRIGRRKTLFCALFFAGAGFFVLQFAASLIVIAILVIAIDFSEASFEPVCKALISDRLAPDQRLRAFSHRYLANNIGFAIGPPLGAYAGVADRPVAFELTAAVYFVYLGVLWLIYRSAGSTELHADTAHTPSLSALLQALRERRLLLITVGSILALSVHGQMGVTFSQYLTAGFRDGVRMFAWLMTTNAITVVICQPLLSRVGQSKGPLTAIVFGAIGLFLGAIGFAYANTLPAFALAMVVFTWGEILLVPAEYAIVDSLAPPHMRGVYFGVHSLSNMGNLFGPWLGGLLLMTWGGFSLFYAMAAIVMVSLVFFIAGIRTHNAARPECAVVMAAHER